MVALDKATSVIDAANTIVIKIGSSILVDDDSHSVNAAWLAGIADDIAALKADGKNVVVVSSGAIALGSHVLGLGGQTLALEEKQAAAAAGQVVLAHAWSVALAAQKLGTAAPHHHHFPLIFYTGFQTPTSLASRRYRSLCELGLLMH